jgi:hypothetical protein
MGSKSLRSGRGAARHLHRSVAAVGAVLVAGVLLGDVLSAQAPVSQNTPAGVRARRYRATGPIVRDQVTGERRMPTETEVADLVANLSTLTQRPSNLPEVTTAQGAVAADLSGGYGGVVLGKANEDGTVETLCVFTFEEGAAFLGLEPIVE